MKKKLIVILPFILMPVSIPVYQILDSLILVDLFGCGCVPSVQTNRFNIAFNANDLRLTVLSLLTILLTVCSMVISRTFSRKILKPVYCLGTFLLNAMLTLWAVKTFMWL